MNREDNGRGGSGWRYQCKSCGHEVGIDSAFPKTCPGCQAGGWWGMLTAKKRHDTIPTISEHPNQLCHRQTDADTRQSAQNKGNPRGLLTPEKHEGSRGPKFKVTPDDLILDLSNQGNKPREIAEVLEGKGIKVSWRTVHRRLESMRRADDVTEGAHGR